MLQSQLPGEDLAQIWDLADFNSDGRLTRDGFAIAYHLIKKKLAGQPLPAQLPSSLMPPSLRKSTSFFQPPQPQPEPPRDLLDFDDTPPASAISPQPTGIIPALQPQGTGGTAVPPIPSRNSANDPFASSPFSSSSPFSAGSTSDLMGDHDDRSHTTSPPLQDQSAELGNVRNQLQSTTRSLDSTKAERAKLESTLASQAAELSALQTQLSSAKAAYDTETTLLSQLKERYANQSADIQKAREELIRSESDLSAIRVEKAEIEQAFLRDKEEARDLHRRMIEAGQQADQLKGELEKAKKEAKQQKGRLAIARKQLSTKEAEKAKVEKELEGATTEVQTVTQEAEEVEAQLTKLIEQPQPVRALSQDTIDVAAVQPLPASPEPMASSKSNNPFERLATTSSPSPRSQSPFLPFSNAALTSPPIGPPEGQNGQAPRATQSSFDDFFGVESPPPVPAAEAASKPASHVNGDSSPKQLDIAATPASPVTSTEHFVIPPTTTNNDGPSESSDNLANAAKARFPTLDDAATSFPAVEDLTLSETNKQDVEQHTTDLTTRLQELEVDETDSNDSDDDDDSPLAEVAQKAKEKTTAPAVDSKPAEVAPSAATTASSPPIVSKSSFDDIFGSNDTSTAPVPAPVINSAPEIPKPSASPFDISTTQASESTKPNDTAGVNAFDETLSGFSPPPSAASAQFTFDGFEDSFDFGAAGVSSPPVQTTTSPAQPSFDDIFASPSPAAPAQQQRTTSAPFTNGSMAPTETPKLTSFDDAFASFDANPNLKLESSFITTTSTNTEGQTTSSSKPFPSSGPVSPKAADASSPRPSVNRPSSPSLRPASPPARVTSPAPRKSTSSKDSHEKLKEPATRSSKLSIRFPFGKKKNKHPEPVPSTLSPPAEESHRTATPAGDDDAEAVKQIIDMGFSRSQAVEALEKSGYDVTRAINSLL
ncbi:hypothetical protein AN958_04147 [Leucoagaricus sp. SymC.cos]|nr:hypothetical protein AN958_04147 [Leucoagaricus sp. SymC.cos]